ncbi:hypothetical protein H5410_061634 [Solanum commersonii]|uniref:Uncharacterized protein n=1 Tax=Solanum commersonii TaxID=4109 RepID=A0A9J5W9E4_SOLCO|nr:hypothetical protein H5410_061634 [Solanum commersonii]
MEVYLNLLAILRNNTTMRVGDGSMTSFWKDKWLGHASLKTLFPKIRTRLDATLVHARVRGACRIRSIRSGHFDQSREKKWGRDQFHGRRKLTAAKLSPPSSPWKRIMKRQSLQE